MIFDEYFAFEGPPRHETYDRRNPNRPKRPPRKKSDDRCFDKPIDCENEKIPGTHDYLCLRQAQVASFRNKAGFPCYLKTGISCGERRPQAEERWRVAKENAFKMLEPIIKAVEAEIIDEPTTIDEQIKNLKKQLALESLLDIAAMCQGSLSVRERLEARKALLRQCDALPTTRHEHTLSSPEAALDALPSPDTWKGLAGIDRE